MPDVSKVVLGNETLIDLTADTVSAATLIEGETAHDAGGAAITGTAQPRTWDAVAFVCGTGTRSGSSSFGVLSRRLWGADPAYFSDPMYDATDDLMALPCLKAGIYNVTVFARGSNNSKANFRVTKNGTTEFSISSAPNTGTLDAQSVTLAVGDVLSFTARNANSSSSSTYALSAYIYYPEEQA